jgi:hypothetical protein
MKVETKKEEAPLVVLNVSRSYFSVARHYGGCTIQGKKYIYMTLQDALIRQDKIKEYNKSLKEGKNWDEFLSSLKR